MVAIPHHLGRKRVSRESRAWALVRLKVAQGRRHDVADGPYPSLVGVRARVTRPAHDGHDFAVLLRLDLVAVGHPSVTRRVDEDGVAHHSLRFILRLPARAGRKEICVAELPAYGLADGPRPTDRGSKRTELAAGQAGGGRGAGHAGRRQRRNRQSWLRTDHILF